MDKLIKQGHLTTYDSFEACYDFVRSEVLSIAIEASEYDWKQYGTFYTVYGNGTRVHPVDKYRVYETISPVIQMVSACLSRGVMILLRDSSTVEEMHLDCDVQQLMSIEAREDPWETPWTEGDIGMLTVHLILTERSLAKLKALLRVWMCMESDFVTADEILRAEFAVS